MCRFNQNYKGLKSKNISIITSDPGFFIFEDKICRAEINFIELHFQNNYLCLLQISRWSAIVTNVFKVNVNTLHHI